MRSVIALCSDDIAQRLIETRPDTFTFAHRGDWASIPALMDEIDGVLLCQSGDVPSLPGVVTLARRFPEKTVALVAPTCEDAMLIDVCIVSAFPPERADARRIWSEYTYADVRTRLRILARAVESAGLSPALTQMLTSALRRPRPFASVAELSDFTGLNRKTLWRHWDAEGAVFWPVRLLDVLDWITLVHVTARKTPAHTWASLASWAGVSGRTLSRQAVKLMHGSLAELAALEKDAALTRLTERLGRLLARAPLAQPPVTHG